MRLAGDNPDYGNRLAAARALSAIRFMFDEWIVIVAFLLRSKLPVRTGDSPSRKVIFAF